MSSGPSRLQATTALVARLARTQARAPLWFVGAVALVVAACAVLAAQLELRPRLEELLPDDQPSVVELRRLHSRVGRATILSIVVEGGEAGLVRQAGDAIAAELSSRRPSWLVDASAGVRVERAFLLPRAGLFLDRGELERTLRELESAWSEQVLEGMGLGLDLDEPGTRQGGFKGLADRLVAGTAALELGDRWPDGYFQSRDGRALVVLVRTNVAIGELLAARQALEEAQRVVAGVTSRPAFTGIRVGYAGDLVTGLAEYGAIAGDLVRVGAVGVSLVLLVLLAFFGRGRVIGVLAANVGTGLVLTFGLTRLAIGHLDIATGFMVSIVAGNGINAGIIYTARYVDARRGGQPPADAVRLASTTTWLPTFGGAAAAAAAYASLGVSGFRGLQHFAFVGAAGMLLCWLATFLVTPPLLVLSERLREMRWGPGDRMRAPRDRPLVVRGALLSALVTRHARPVLLVSTALTLAAAITGVRYVRHLPIEYDMRKLENDVGEAAERARLGALARQILGVNLESSMTVLAERLEQVPPLKRALEERRDASPRDRRPFEAVHSLYDYVARDQEAKLPVLLRIASLLRRAREADRIDDEEWRRVEPLLPPPDLRPFGIADLPAELARSFQERDGTRGRLVYIEPTAGEDDNDMRYLIRWTDAFREVQLPGGEAVHGSGRALIFADMLVALLRGMPRALALSMVLTVAAVASTFRRGRFTALVIGSLLLGVLWLSALLSQLEVRFNFLNVVAIPVTLGIGVDYALNILSRYASGEDIRAALERSAPAVLLCSLTTILSYLALLRSINRAVRSLGLVAVLGEVCCLAAALIAVPAAIAWWEHRGRSRS